MSGRDEILDTLRARSRGDVERPSREAMKRAIPARATRPGVDLFALFRERASRRGAETYLVADPEELLAEAAAIAGRANISSASIAPSLSELDWGRRLAVTAHPPTSDDALAISVASAAIAETGTAVLSTDENAHSASVIPANHIVCLPRSRLVPTMEDALALVGSPLPRAVIFLTGVSSTGDIGLRVIAPAQGPSAVHVIFVDDWS